MLIFSVILAKKKNDYLFRRGKKFGQFFWAPTAVEHYQNRPGHVPATNKVNYYGIRGITIEWFWSYLKKRKQFVSIKNNMSSIKEISAGAP